MRNTTQMVLVLGASGMLGNAVLRIFAEADKYIAIGTVRSEKAAQLLPSVVRESLIVGYDIGDVDNLV